MLFVFVSIAFVAFTTSAPVYENLNDLVQKEYFLSTIISTSTSSTHSTTTIVFTKIEQIHRIKDTIDTAADYLRILLPSIFVFISILISIMGFCLRKCLMNNGQCKVAWYRPKSLKEYRRREDITRRREIVIDQFLQQSSPIYSIA